MVLESWSIPSLRNTHSYGYESLHTVTLPFRPKLSPVPVVPGLTQTPSLATTDASALPRSIPAIQVIADGMGMVYGSQGLPFQNMDPN
jgi:hypothetical protein